MTFADNLVALLKSHETTVIEGIPYVTAEQMFSLISRVMDYKITTLIGSDLVVQAIADNRINWATSVKFETSGKPHVSLLGYLVQSLHFNNPIEACPEVFEAMNERFSISDQVRMLSRSHVLPLTSFASVKTEQAMTGRLAQHALQSAQHLDAWVDTFAGALRYRHECFADLNPELNHMQIDFSAGLSEAPSGEQAFGASPVVLTLVSILRQTMWKKAFGKYGQATAYSLAASENFGHGALSSNLDCRSNIRFALTLLEHEALDAFIREEIGRKPIDERDVRTCAALLGSVPYWSTENLSVDEILEKGGSFAGGDPFNHMLRDYMLDRSSTWFERAAANPLASKLMEKVLTSRSFEVWLYDATTKSRMGNITQYKPLSHWMKVMPEEDKAKVRELLHSSAVKELRGRGVYSNGIMRAKMLVAAFPDEQATKDFVDEQMGYIVKRSLYDKDTQLLAHLMATGLTTAKEFVQRIRNPDELLRLSDKQHIPMSMLLPHVPAKLKVGAMARRMSL
ncbi:hypothetical protein ACYPKM_05500 [Pseudomonas aeruginosa]